MSTVESHASHKDAQFGQDNESDLTIFQFLSENTTEGLSKVISKTSELYNKYLEYKYLESEIKEEAKNQDKEWKRLRTLMDKWHKCSSAVIPEINKGKKFEVRSIEV